MKLFRALKDRKIQEKILEFYDLFYMEKIYTNRQKSVITRQKYKNFI